jgi:hypothetical protein
MLSYKNFILEFQNSCPLISRSHMDEFEKLVNRLLDRFKIELDFTKHFRERMSDSRNDPCISLQELGAIIHKLYSKYKNGEQSLSKYKDTEIVLKDVQSDLNIPVALEYDRKNDKLEITAKTIMRKKKFLSPDPIVRI